MNFRELEIKGVIEITPTVFNDSRGYFFEFFHRQTFAKNGIAEDFLQDNHSYSLPGVIRGLHFQKTPHAQKKLVRILKGKIFDVAVDLRRDSPTFGQSISLIMDDQKHNMIYIPGGFAHGFAAMEESIVNYKCTALYHKESECGIRFDDPRLNIQWPVDQAIVSDKDKILKSFDELVKLGEI